MKDPSCHCISARLVQGCSVPDHPCAQDRPVAFITSGWVKGTGRGRALEMRGRAGLGAGCCQPSLGTKALFPHPLALLSVHGELRMQRELREVMGPGPQGTLQCTSEAWISGTQWLPRSKVLLWLQWAEMYLLGCVSNAFRAVQIPEVFSGVSTSWAQTCISHAPHLVSLCLALAGKQLIHIVRILLHCPLQALTERRNTDPEISLVLSPQQRSRCVPCELCARANIPHPFTTILWHRGEPPAGGHCQGL